MNQSTELHPRSTAPNTTIAALGFALALLLPILANAASTVTFDNQSGKSALVKLIGPTPSSVSVENNKKESVSVGPGHYFIKIRYGTPGAYSYSKGDEFDVKETATTASDITITLHKVVAGNYETQPISEKDFGEPAEKAGLDVEGALRREDVGGQAAGSNVVLFSREMVKVARLTENDLNRQVTFLNNHGDDLSDSSLELLSKLMGKTVIGGRGAVLLPSDHGNFGVNASTRSATWYHDSTSGSIFDREGNNMRDPGEFTYGELLTNGIITSEAAKAAELTERDLRREVVFLNSFGDKLDAASVQLLSKLLGKPVIGGSGEVVLPTDHGDFRLNVSTLLAGQRATRAATRPLPLSQVRGTANAPMPTPSASDAEVLKRLMERRERELRQ